MTKTSTGLLGRLYNYLPDLSSCNIHCGKFNHREDVLKRRKDILGITTYEEVSV